MIKIGVVVASLFLYILILWYGADGNPFLPFTVYFPQLHLIVIFAFLAILILGQDIVLFIPLARFVEHHRYKIFPLLGLLTAITINILVFDNIPHVQDGIHYKYMAEVFAHGKLSQAMPDHYEFFSYPFFMVDGVRHFSLFMPGFPVFLIPFSLLDLSSLANPILTAFNILLIGYLARYMFGTRTSTYSMLLFVFSPFMMMLSGTWMPHPFTALLTILAAFSLVKYWYTREFYLPIVAGSAIGWMVFTRPQNALFLVVLFFVIGVFQFDHKHFIRTSILFFSPIVIGIIFLLAYNYNFTGNPFTFIQDIYFNISEPVNDCHGIGMGTGCFHCNGESLPDGGMTWRHGVKVTQDRIIPLLMDTFPHPLYFWFIIFSLVFTINNRSESRKKIFLVALFLAPVFGYFLFYFHGNTLGPRYLYEGSVFLMVLGASGIDGLLRYFVDSKFRIGSLIVISFLVGSLLHETRVTVPSGVMMYKNGFWGVGPLLKEMVEEQDLRKAVFFVSIINEASYGNGLIAMDMWDFEGSENIFVRDLGDESNSKYMHYMKGWNYYRVRYFPGGGQTVHPKITKPVLPEDFLQVEMEDKFLPYLRNEGNPDYCNVFPVQKHIERQLEFGSIDHVWLSGGRSLYCRFVNDDQSYTFGQYFQNGGIYDGKMAALAGPVFCDFELLMDGWDVVSFEASGEENVGMVGVNFRVFVSEGLHTFSIAPKISSLPDRNFVMLDYIRFNIVGDRMPGVGEAISNQPAGVGQRTEKEGPEGG